MSARAAGAAVLAVALCQPCAARAQAVAPGDTEREARAHFERGVALIDALRWRDAVPELEAARALSATPAVLYNLGLACRTVGRDLEAIECFREFLRASGGGLDDPRRVQVERYLGELVAALARLDVTAAPSDAQITLDGAHPAAASVELDPGAHTLVATHAGYHPRVLAVELAPGERRRVRLGLAPLETVTAGHPHPPASPWPWIALGSALTAVAVGATIFTIVLLSQPPPPPPASWGMVSGAETVWRP